MDKSEYIKMTFDKTIDVKLSNKLFDECIFSSCDFSSKDFTKSKFIDCKFINCNLSLLKLDSARLQNVIFANCKILGVNFGDVDKFLLRLRFNECLIKNSYFTDIKIPNTDFTSSEILDCEFSSVDLSNSNFSNTNLKDTYFRKCNLTNSNFISSKNYIISPIENEISGAKFSIPEVLGLLESFDIKIE